MRYLLMFTLFLLSLTKHKGQNPFPETNSRLAEQNISPLLRKRTAHYRVQPNTGPSPKPDESRPHRYVFLLSDQL